MSARRRTYNPTDVKRMFALSYNRCAAEDCPNPIVADATQFDAAQIVGQIAHIVASSADGPRGDPDFPAEALDDEPNLILLCPTHHTMVDKQPATYTVDVLRRWKREHRRRNAARLAGPDPGPSVVPLQVPNAPGGFVNRVGDMAELDRLTSHPDPGGAAVVLLTGAHGVGKTALSRYWARRNRDRFTDGQLHVDFGDLQHRGGAAVSDVLGDFLKAIDVPDSLIPPDLPRRLAEFRSRTQDRRLLVVLDDPQEDGQVLQLQPSSEASVVLVNGRTPLPAVIRERGRRLRLEPLDRAGAAALLESMVGPARVSAEPDAVAQLVAFCEGLPLALRICGARLVVNERRPVSWLIALLEDEQNRLAELSQLDAIFNDAYRALAPDEQQLYRRLGEHPGLSFAEPLAAAAAGRPVGETRRLLGRLSGAHLVEDEGDRYRFHGLVRLHAQGCAARDESLAEREEVLCRIVRFYAHATRAADVAITPSRLRVLPAPEGEPPAGTQFKDDHRAFSWFESERPNILAVLRAAARRGLDLEVCQICEALWPCYFNRKPYTEWIEAYGLAVDAARRLGSAAAEARLRSALAKALTETGRHDRAQVELTAARRTAERSGDLWLQASVIEFQGHLELERRRYSAAQRAFERARDMHAEADVPRGVTLNEFHVGRALAGRGEHRQAVDAFETAIGGIDRARDEPLLGRVLIALAMARLELGAADAAATAATEALAIAQSRGLHYYEARALEVLAQLALDRGEFGEAATLWRQAYAYYHDLASPRADELASRLTRPPEPGPSMAPRSP